MEIFPTPSQTEMGDSSRLEEKEGPDKTLELEDGEILSPIPGPSRILQPIKINFAEIKRKIEKNKKKLRVVRKGEHRTYKKDDKGRAKTPKYTQQQRKGKEIHRKLR